jgi:hypothetical protein
VQSTHARVGAAIIGVILSVGMILGTAAPLQEQYIRDHHTRTIYDIYADAELQWSYSDTPCRIYTAHEVGGCFDGFQVFISSDYFEGTDGFTTWALWHEFHHYLDQIEGIPYTGIANECAADAFAYAHDHAAAGMGWGYGCVDGTSDATIP